MKIMMKKISINMWNIINDQYTMKIQWMAINIKKINNINIYYIDVCL